MLNRTRQVPRMVRLVLRTFYHNNFFFNPFLISRFLWLGIWTQLSRLLCLRVSDEAAQGQGSHLKAVERSLLLGFSPSSAVGSRVSVVRWLWPEAALSPWPHGPLHVSARFFRVCTRGQCSKMAREAEVRMHVTRRQMGRYLAFVMSY